MTTTPYRGIDPFRFVDHAIFFAREEEEERLISLVSVYRGVLLYGDSGAGKSSLVNAGLLPAAISFQPERVRVQPREGQELVIERIATSEDHAGFLPSLFAGEDEHSSRLVLGVSEFEEQVRTAAGSSRPLLVFDQFEEILTLFAEARGQATQARLVELLVRLLREPLPVKLLFVFREDYLGKIRELLAACPELVDQALRLASPSAEALPSIIRGPFERYPGHFAHELTPALAKRLCGELAERFGSGEVSLSEVQTVCLRLWQSDDAEALLAEKGVQGLLEDYLGEALDTFSPELRVAAIALLGQLVTSAGTRNVISAEDLEQRVREEEDIPPALLSQALERLESESKLVRCERRRDLYLYEITSEFLVPWISRRRDELRQQLDRRRERRRLLILSSIAAALLVIVAVVVGLAVWALRTRSDAQSQAARATSLALASAAKEQLGSPEQVGTRPDAALLLALEAVRVRDLSDARSSMISALNRARQSSAEALLHGNADNVDGVALTPDGRTLASAGADGTVRLWDAHSHKQLGQPLTGHLGPVDAVSFSPDGQTLASAGDDGTIRIWDVRTHTLRVTLTRQGPVNGAFLTVAFSPDGHTLAGGDTDGTIWLWDLNQDDQLIDQLPGNEGSVNGVAFSPDGRTLASASDDGTVRLWDAHSHKQLGQPLTGHLGPVDAVSFSPDGQTLASAGDDGTIRIWNRRGRKQIGLLTGHNGPVFSIAFRPDGRMLASAGADGTVRLWDAHSHKQLGQPLTGHTDQVVGVVFSPNGSTLFSGSTDNTIRVWDLRSNRKLDNSLRGHKGLVYKVVFSPDGRTLASASDDVTIRLWDVRNHKELGQPLLGGTKAVESVAFSPDGQTLASAGDDWKIRFWDLRNHKHLGQPLTGQAGYSVKSVSFSPDGQTLASAGDDRKIRLWDVRNHRQLGQPFRGHSRSVEGIVFSPDGHTLASASDDGTIRFWDVQSHRELAPPLIGRGGPIYSVAFSPDGHTLASAGVDTTVRLWDVRSRKQIGQPMTGHKNSVDGVVFSPDGRMLASAGADGTIRLWDVQSHRQLIQLNADTDTVESVAFSPDGRILASAGDNGTIQLWEGILWSNYHDLQKQVCSLVGTGFSRPEWEEFAPQIAPDIRYHQSCP